MSEKTITPTDRLTNLPLPLIPAGDSRGLNWHHHFHPERNPLLKEADGLAVRNSRVQLIDWARHDEYHKFYNGPELPETEDQKISAVIMAVAGYLPNRAIDYFKGEPCIVPIKPELRSRMQLSGEIRVDSNNAVRTYLRSYILSHDYRPLNLSDNIIDEFLNTSDLARRYEIGHSLLAKITDKVIQPVDETYATAYRQNLILPGLPRSVRKFAKTRLGTRRNRDVMVAQLHKRWQELHI